MAEVTTEDLRMKVLNAADIDSEIVEVPEWGVKLEVRSMSALERTQATMEWMDQKTGAVAPERMYPVLLIHTVFNPDTGERLFDESSAAAINSKNAAAVQRLVDVAMRLSGMTPEAVEEAGEGSGSTGD